MTTEQQEWHKLAEEQFTKNVLSLQTFEIIELDFFPKEHKSLLKEATPLQTLTICKGQPIPNGFVIVGQTTNFACSSSLDNAWIIKRPAQQETICKGSPIPVGYVIIGQTTNFSCSSSLDNAWIIKIPAEQETICKGSPIPAGYVIIGQTTNFGCSSSLDNSWVIKRI